MVTEVCAVDLKVGLSQTSFKRYHLMKQHFSNYYKDRYISPIIQTGLFYQSNISFHFVVNKKEYKLFSAHHNL